MKASVAQWNIPYSKVSERKRLIDSFSGLIALRSLGEQSVTTLYQPTDIFHVPGLTYWKTSSRITIIAQIHADSLETFSLLKDLSPNATNMTHFVW